MSLENGLEEIMGKRERVAAKFFKVNKARGMGEE